MSRSLWPPTAQSVARSTARRTAVERHAWDEVWLSRVISSLGGSLRPIVTAKVKEQYL